MSDTAAGINGCANSRSYWCTAFQSYYATGSPLELQQGGLSDPLDSTCVPPFSIGINGCGYEPIGDVGDLRMWMPLEVSSRANVIELFYLDAALAFDPNYPSYNITNSGTFLTAAQQTLFFNIVGQGTTCSGGSGSGNGDCSYANVINQIHNLRTH